MSTLPRAEPVEPDANRLSPSQRRTAWLPVAITAGVLALSWALLP